MNTFWGIFIVIFGVVHSCQAVYLGGRPTQQNLANLFFSSRLTSRDPAVTMACFSDYIIKSNEVSETYSTGYKQCLLDAKDGRLTIDKDYEPNRQSIDTSARNVCSQLGICNELNNTLAFFSCHAEIGANTTKAAYDISGNASEYASVIQEQYRLIDLRHDQCCKSAERKYVEQTAVVYSILQGCLGGRTPPTTEVPSTTTPSTTTTGVPSTTTTTTSSSSTSPSTTPETTTTAVSSTTELISTTEQATSKLDPRNIASEILKLFN